MNLILSECFLINRRLRVVFHAVTQQLVCISIYRRMYDMYTVLFVLDPLGAVVTRHRSRVGTCHRPCLHLEVARLTLRWALD